jgi:hypothetical protein
VFNKGMSADTLVFLDPNKIKATVPEGGSQPRLEIEGQQSILNARIRRIFPLSEPESYYSVQDGEGHEVGLLESLEGLEPATRQVFDAEIDRRYFMPVIEKILFMKLDGGLWKFVVVTQRGENEFYVRNWRDSAHEIALNQWQIQAVDGQRYMILDLEKLDEKSQRFLDDVF